MANFRNFTLYNSTKTESIGLNDFDGYLVTTPSGLGIYLKNSYLDVGSKRILTAQKSAFQEITLVVDIFAKTRDEIERKYEWIRDFISRYRSDGFKLGYLAYAGAKEERYIDCDIKILDKGEKSTSRYMSIPLTIEPRTIWRVDEDRTGSLQNEQVNKWAFSLDGNLAGVSSYNVLTAFQQGTQNISINGYNFLSFPQGLDFTVSVKPSIESTPIDVTFSLGDFKAETENLYGEMVVDDPRIIVAEKTFLSDSSTKHTVKATISVKDRTISIGTFQYSLITGDLSEGTDYVYEERKDPSGSCCIEVSTDNWIMRDVDIYIKYKWRPHGVTNIYEQEKHFKKASGTKYSYLVLNGKGEIYEELSSISEKVSVWDPVGEDGYYWKVSGLIYQGISNYVESFAEDANILGYYNIAMFSGSIVKATISNSGETESPLKIRIWGAALNPDIKIFKKGTLDLVQRTKLNYTLPAGAYIEIDSDPENTGAWAISQNGTRTNIITNIDQTTNMFLTVPKGEYDVQITDDLGGEVSTTLFFKREYLGA